MEEISLSTEKLELMREKWHPDCFACGGSGMKIKHTVASENYLESLFFCDDKFCGYGNKMHGGIITTLLDSAMTNCLFAAGIAAVTGELKIRFFKPVIPGKNLSVKAWITDCKSPLYALKSALYQDGRLKSRASAKFMKIN